MPDAHSNEMEMIPVTKLNSLLRWTAFLLCIAMLLSGAVLAISTEDAKEPIDTSAVCSLTLTYAEDSAKFRGLEINLYKIADVSADFQYTLVPALSGTGVELNGVKSQYDWRTIITTVNSFVVGYGLPYYDQQITDVKGKVQFTGLTPGMYLVKWTGNKTADRVYGFPPSLIAVPGLGTDGKWIYDLEALPKPGYADEDIPIPTPTPTTEPTPTPTPTPTPEPTPTPGTEPTPTPGPIDIPEVVPTPGPNEWCVVKLWEDESGEIERPSSINVVIYKNGVAEKTVTLSSESDWYYIWESLEPGTEWVVMEQDIPEHYTMRVSQEGRQLVMVNHYEEEEEESDGDDTGIPRTGDTVNIQLYVTLLCISGVLLLLLALLGLKRNRR